MSALLQALRALADIRVTREDAALELKARRAAFDLEHAELLEQVKSGTSLVAAQEAVVRSLALEVHLNTGEKRPAPGVEIKLYKTMSVLDQAAALAWAKQTQMALIPESVDQAALLKIAAATPLPFVLYGDDPRVTIAVHLNGAALLEEVAS